MQESAVPICVGILLAMVLAGVPHAFWLRSRKGDFLRVPLDFGLTFRGRRLLGDHKTLRGFVVLIPATAVSFSILGYLVTNFASVWRIPSAWVTPQLAWPWLGVCVALGYMLAEFPNSFLKRQFCVPPGQAPKRRGWSYLCFTVDQGDSVIGGLLVLLWLTPLTQVQALCLGIASFFARWGFNCVFYLAGFKSRPR